MCVCLCVTCAKCVFLLCRGAVASSGSCAPLSLRYWACRFCFAIAHEVQRLNRFSTLSQCCCFCWLSSKIPPCSTAKISENRSHSRGRRPLTAVLPYLYVSACWLRCAVLCCAVFFAVQGAAAATADVTFGSLSLCLSLKHPHACQNRKEHFANLNPQPLLALLGSPGFSLRFAPTPPFWPRRCPV